MKVFELKKTHSCSQNQSPPNDIVQSVTDYENIDHIPSKIPQRLRSLRYKAKDHEIDEGKNLNEIIWKYRKRKPGKIFYETTDRKK